MLADYFREKALPAGELSIPDMRRTTNIVGTGFINADSDPTKNGEVTLSSRRDPKSFPCTKRRYKNPKGTSLNYNRGKKVVVGTKHTAQSLYILALERNSEYTCNPQNYMHRPPGIKKMIFNNAVVSCNTGFPVDRVKMVSEMKHLDFRPTTFAGLNVPVQHIVDDINRRCARLHASIGSDSKLRRAYLLIERLGSLLFKTGKVNFLGRHLWDQLIEIRKKFRRMVRPFKGVEVMPEDGKKIAETLRDAIKANQTADKTIPSIDDSTLIREEAERKAKFNASLIPIGAPNDGFAPSTNRRTFNKATPFARTLKLKPATLDADAVPAYEEPPQTDFQIDLNEYGTWDSLRKDDPRFQ
jgi:TATA-box binding protein (TBP) (component of TFIID and TFIIIB)